MHVGVKRHSSGHISGEPMPDERREQGLSYADKFLHPICTQGIRFFKNCAKRKASLLCGGEANVPVCL